MSDNKPLLEFQENGDFSRVSNTSYSSISSRSTLIKDLLTSDQSKQLVEEIDRKIVSLVNIIKSKKCSEKRKKYYTKKIVNRIVDSKYTNTTLNTDEFNRQSIPTSTPYENETEKNTEKIKSTINHGAGDLRQKYTYIGSSSGSPDVNNDPHQVPNKKDTSKKLIPINLNYNVTEINTESTSKRPFCDIRKDCKDNKSDKSLPLVCSSKDVGTLTPETFTPIEFTPTGSLSKGTNDYVLKVNKLPNNYDDLHRDSVSKGHEIAERLKILTTKFKNCKTECKSNYSPDLSPHHLQNSTKQTDTIITKIEKNVAEVKKSLSNNKIKNTEISLDSIDAAKSNEVKNIHKEQMSLDSGLKSNPILNDDKKQNGNINEGRSITNLYKNMVTNNVPKLPEYSTFKDLTPRTLCEIYKLEFNETSSSNKMNSASSTDDQLLDKSVSQSKDWKYYKTTSEKIFDKKQKKIKESQKSRKDYIVKYAKKEKMRQIIWINNEINCLTKLKQILEDKSIENLTHSEASSVSTQYKQTPNLADSESSCSAGTKTLHEINLCLEKLQNILKHRKSNKTIKSSLINLDAYSQKLDKISSKNTSVTNQILPDNSIQLNNNSKGTDKSIQTTEDSSTSYKKIESTEFDVLDYFPKNKIPTEFEVKYFLGNTLSSRTSDESNKENFILSDTEINSALRKCPISANIITKRSIEVQTSFVNSLSSSNTNDRLSKMSNKNLEDSPSVQQMFNDEINEINNNKPLIKSDSVAYLLTFEEIPNGDADKSIKKTKSNLQKMTVQVPAKRKPSNMSTNIENDNLELKECLSKHRSDFIKSAEWRRQCINELMYMRGKKYEDISKKMLFTVKEMRELTNKKYKQTEEVQNKIQLKKCQLQRVFNRQLASIFSKKLQERTLKGEVSISTNKAVIYS